MNRIETCLAVALLASVASAAFHPTVSDVTISTANNGTMVSVSFSLDEPAIVTLDLVKEIDGQSIGAAAIGEVPGANGVFAKGFHTITWKPHKAASDMTGVVPGVKAKLTAYAKDDPPDYLVVDLTKNARSFFYATTNDFPYGFGNAIYKTDRLVLKRVHAKNRTFRMGSAPTAKRHRVEELAHTVSFAGDYYLGVFELTQRQARQFTPDWKGYWPSESQCSTVPNSVDGLATTETYPMAGLSYIQLRENTNCCASTTYSWPQGGREVRMKGSDDECSVIDILNWKTGLHFDLPTEAEWEFACLAGHTAADFGDGTVYEDEQSGLDMAWTTENNPTETSPKSSCPHGVGLKKPNDWGFYDMHGNVDEWCLDWFAADYGKSGGEIGPTGPAKENADPAPSLAISRTDYCRVRRGGHNNNTTASSIGHYRFYETPNTKTKNIGVRLWCEVRF